MPSSFIYIDSYKSKVGDLTKIEDAIMSASKFLNKKAGFSKLIEWNKIPEMQKLKLIGTSMILNIKMVRLFIARVKKLAKNMTASHVAKRSYNTSEAMPNIS